MSIKQQYDNVEDIPQGLDTYYTKGEEGGYTLSVEGMVEKGKLNEFRDNNISLRQDIEAKESQLNEYESKIAEAKAAAEEIASKYSDIDMEAWQAFQEEKKSLAEKELIEAGEVDTLIQQRIEEVAKANSVEVSKQKEMYEGQLQALQKEITSYDSQLNTMLVDNALTKIAAESGVRSSAMDDVLSRGRGVFRVDNGKATAFDQDGRQMYAPDAVTPLSIDGWISGLTESAPHLFEMSTGAGMQQPTHSPAPAAEPKSAEQMILAGLGNLT